MDFKIQPIWDCQVLQGREFGIIQCCSNLIKLHFSPFQALVVSMAKQRNSLGICPPEVLKFVLDLFKYNDNSRNKVYFNSEQVTLNICIFK